MNTQKITKYQRSEGHGKYGRTTKALAMTLAAFFMLTGIAMPVSFAAAPVSVSPVTNQPVPTISVVQANAKPAVTPAPVPSGSLAASLSNPLSAATPKVSTPVVPKGWTVAVSNANYAFQIKVAGMNNFLLLKDLKTGKETQLVKVQPAGKDPESISGLYDVSSDGTTVIYGTTTKTSGKIFVEKIGKTPVQQLLLSGKLQAISFGTDANKDPIASIKLQQPSNGKSKVVKVNLKKFTTV